MPGIEPPGWTADPEAPSWPKWQDDLGPPPALPHDHPSAPMPRVQLPTEYPLEPLPEAPALGAPDLPRWQRGRQARSWSAPRQQADRSHQAGNRRQHAIPDGGAAVDRLVQSDQPGPARWGGTGYQRQASPALPRPEPAGRRFQNGYSRDQDSLWSAAQVLALADGRAAQIAEEAQDNAAAMREAAERQAAAITQRATDHADAITRQATAQAAAIREAAEREAAELRARLDSMSGELGRIAGYVTENLAAQATPALPAAGPARLGRTAAEPHFSPAGPDDRPARSVTLPTRPDSTPARPAIEQARPATRSAGPDRPKTTPTTGPQQRPRQVRAIRIAKYGTATLVLFSLITGAAEMGLHGFKFFVFRPGGVGETRGHETDQQFLAREAAAAHHAAAPKGRHHRTR